MPERERMLRGEPYNARDESLLATAHRARALLARFAALPSTDGGKRRAVLTELFGTIGDNVTIGAGSVVTSDIPSDSLAFGQPCRVQRSLS